MQSLSKLMGEAVGDPPSGANNAAMGASRERMRTLRHPAPGHARLVNIRITEAQITAISTATKAWL
jgi:hypothetical protein